MVILILHVVLHILKSFSYIAITSSFSQKLEDSFASIIVHFAGETKSGLESADNSVPSKAPIKNETYLGSSSSL